MHILAARALAGCATAALAAGVHRLLGVVSGPLLRAAVFCTRASVSLVVAVALVGFTLGYR